MRSAGLSVWSTLILYGRMGTKSSPRKTFAADFCVRCMGERTKKPKGFSTKRGMPPEGFFSRKKRPKSAASNLKWIHGGRREHACRLQSLKILHGSILAWMAGRMCSRNAALTLRANRRNAREQLPARGTLRFFARKTGCRMAALAPAIPGIKATGFACSEAVSIRAACMNGCKSLAAKGRMDWLITRRTPVMAGTGYRGTAPRPGRFS